MILSRKKRENRASRKRSHRFVFSSYPRRKEGASDEERRLFIAGSILCVCDQEKRRLDKVSRALFAAPALRRKGRRGTAAPALYIFCFSLTFYTDAPHLLFTFHAHYVMIDILYIMRVCVLMRLRRAKVCSAARRAGEGGEEMKKVVYSAVQPTSQLTLGNYLGAVNNWLKLQQDESKERIFAVADLHSLTIRREAREVRENTLSLLAQFLAFGLDEKRNIIYVQSHVPAHTQLAWILNCYTYVGEMSRMTQFKDKSAKHADNVNMGLMDYPVLMAADILLYDTDLVPVGVDQVQHLEIARDIAIRFNNIYGETFKVPEALLGRAGAKIMSLTDPTAKMSKSDPNPMGRINVLDSEADIVKKFKRAVTDSESVIAYDPEKKPGVSNLLAILAAAKGTTPEQEAGECEGLMYGHLKLRAAEAVSAMLRPVRERYEALIKDEEYLLKVAREGAEKAAAIAEKTLKRAGAAVGLLQG